MGPQGNVIIAFNENWQYMFHKVGYLSVNNMISVNRSLYTTTAQKTVGNPNIFKSDEYLNVSSTFNGMKGSDDFGGIYYNMTNNTLYVASCGNQKIILFSLEFLFVDSISTVPRYPFAIQVNNNQIFITTTTGMVLVMVNRVIMQTFQGCINTNSPIHSI